MIGLLRTLFADVPGSRRRFALALLLSLLTALCSVGLMAASGLLISWAAEHPPILWLQTTIVAVRATGLGKGAFRYAERLVSHSLALRLQSGLRLRVYRALAGTTLLGRRKGDLLVRIVTDVEAIQDLVVRVLLPFTSLTVLSVGVSVAIMALSPGAGVGLLVSAALAGAVVPLLARLVSRRADREIAPLRGALADRVGQLNHAAVDLAAYGDERELTGVLEVDRRLERAEARAALVRGAAGALMVLAAGLSVVVALAVGIPAVASGELNRIHLAVLVLTPLALHEVLSDLPQAAQTLTRAYASLGRVRAVLAEPAVGTGDLAAGSESDRPGLALHEASIGWPGEAAILTGVNLSVRPGQRIALTGPSGVGKTTVAATLLGLIEPLAGSVERRGTVGYLAQDAHIFNTTVAENIRIGKRDASPEEIRTALTRAGLDLAPERMVGEDGSALSGGEARRLALARLLVGEHQVWILDEPTEHLDRETADALVADLWAQTEGAAMLVITHDPDLIARCEARIDLQPSVSVQ
ncbi:thiol reductant ABC exporter subunit CydC [Granulicoccus phenolivorans]|uniref:thiol reductant ABC exporter subunit CydC n=1 Tax=Granulicoccus phenolivorans TaxID=266854 RepID=UPI0003F9571D|nr:thiol reductant ABC exporter subunit CydC [Granulicoccus phenolivorans]